MFGVLRPGYRYMYVSLCKNTIEKRKQRQYAHNPLHQTQRYSYVDIECNSLEYVPINTYSRNYILISGEYADSLHGLKESMVGWKSSSFQRRERQYYVLPFILYYDGEPYPMVSFNYTSWLSSQDGADYKLLLRDEDDRSISLALRVLDPSRYVDHSESVEINEDVPAIVQDDEKEPEPIPNKLPMFVIENHMHSEIARSECPIASIGLKECETVSMLGCYHVFDSASIQAWMCIKAECPVCKSKSNIIHTLTVPESLRPQAISLPDEIIEPGSVPAVVKKIPKPGVAPKKIPKPGIAPADTASK